MQVLSGIYWVSGGEGALNQSSISLQEVMSVKGKMVFCVVCDGNPQCGAGEIAGGYAAEKLTAWFHQKAVVLAGKGKGRKQINRSMQCEWHSIYHDMKYFAKKNQTILSCSVTALLLLKNRYQIWHLGNTPVYVYRKRQTVLTQASAAARQKQGSYLDSRQWTAPAAGYGHIYKNSGMLICTNEFCRHITAEKLTEAMLPEEIRTEQSIRKRLKQIADTAAKAQQTGDRAAVYLKIL